MIHNIYDYLKYKWEHCNKSDVLFEVFLSWLLSGILGVILAFIWPLLGAIFFVVWSVIGLICFLRAAWHVCRKLFEQVSEDYNHYVSEFGKHKNENTSPDQQMATLDDLFEGYEEEDPARIDRERGTSHTMGG